MSGRSPIISSARLITFMGIYIGAFLLLFSCKPIHPSPNYPKVIHGQLNLIGINLSNDTIPLDGDWAFYWNRLLAPEDFKSVPTIDPDRWIKTPGIWNNLTVNGYQISGQGVATYRLVISLKGNQNFKTAIQPKSDPEPSVLALYLTHVETAYRIFVNGENLGGVGTVSDSRSLYRPGYGSKIYAVPVTGDQIEIIIQVSNYSHRKGGVDSTILLGDMSSILTSYKHSVFVDLFLFGSVLIIGLYHISLFFVRRSDKSSFYFGVLCFVIAFRTILVGDYFILTMFPALPWRLTLVLEYSTFIIAFPAVALFTHSLFPKEFHVWAIRLIVAFSIIYLVFVLTAPTVVFSSTIIFYQVILMIGCLYIMSRVTLALIRKRDESVYVFIGSVALLATTINDVLYNNLLIPTLILFPVGVFLMVLLQSFMLSKRYSKAFEAVTLLQRSLERRVEERTKELSEKNEQMNRLIHVLCHDLKNPLVNIISISDLARSDPGVWADFNDHIIVAAQNGMEIIDMVKKMEALDTAHFKLNIETYRLIELVDESLNILSQKIKAKNIHISLEMDSDTWITVEKTSFVNSVLNNILTNAIKFSYPGSTILITSKSDQETPGWTILEVMDNGIGMSESLIREVFNPLKPTSRPGTSGETGTGFGMPLVKKFIEAYGGTISISSKEKNEHDQPAGTTIMIRLASK